MNPDKFHGKEFKAYNIWIFCFLKGDKKYKNKVCKNWNYPNNTRKVFRYS